MLRLHGCPHNMNAFMVDPNFLIYRTGSMMREVSGVSLGWGSLLPNLAPIESCQSHPVPYLGWGGTTSPMLRWGKDKLAQWFICSLTHSWLTTPLEMKHESFQLPKKQHLPLQFDWSIHRLKNAKKNIKNWFKMFNC